MAVADAILSATRNRIRPIFMSTLTSVFGMLPLVLFPGAGSELYRGLGSVVIRRPRALRRTHAADRPAAAGGGRNPSAAQAREAGRGPGWARAARDQRGVSARITAPLHAWDLSPKDAIALQKALAGAVVRSDRFGPGGRRAIKQVAGIDAAFADGGRTIRAAVVMLTYPGLDVTDQSLIERPTTFPLRAGAALLPRGAGAAGCASATPHDARPDPLRRTRARPPAPLLTRLPLGPMTGCAHHRGREVAAHRLSRRARPGQGRYCVAARRQGHAARRASRCRPANPRAGQADLRLCRAPDFAEDRGDVDPQMRHALSAARAHAASRQALEGAPDRELTRLRGKNRAGARTHGCELHEIVLVQYSAAASRCCSRSPACPCRRPGGPRPHPHRCFDLRRAAARTWHACQGGRHPGAVGRTRVKGGDTLRLSIPQ